MLADTGALNRVLHRFAGVALTQMGTALNSIHNFIRNWPIHAVGAVAQAESQGYFH
jgi:hypothetical protein